MPYFLLSQIHFYNKFKMSEILYHDNQVTMYKELMVIKKYYFPLATSKTIMFSDIERVTLISSDGVTHTWGLTTKYLNNWFPWDSNRKNKTKFIEIILKGKKTRPSITPDDPDKVFQIIWQNFTPEGKQFAEKKSMKDGNQTQLARNQMQNQQDQVTEQVLTNNVNKQSIKVEEVE